MVREPAVVTKLIEVAQSGPGTEHACGVVVVEMHVNAIEAVVRQLCKGGICCNCTWGEGPASVQCPCTPHGLLPTNLGQ